MESRFCVCGRNIKLFGNSGRKPWARVLIPPGYSHPRKGKERKALAKSKVHGVKVHGALAIGC